MGNIFAPTHLLIILLIVLLLFGRGRLSELMGDLAKGIKNFKTSMREDEDTQEKEYSYAKQDSIKTLDVPNESSAVSQRVDIIEKG